MTEYTSVKRFKYISSARKSFDSSLRGVFLYGGVHFLDLLSRNIELVWSLRPLVP